MKSLGVTNGGDKILIQFSKIISLAIYKNVFVYSAVVNTFSFHKTVSVEQLLRRRAHPHKGLGILREQVKLTRSLEDEYSAVDVVGAAPP